MIWVKLNRIEQGIFAVLVLSAMFLASLSIPLAVQPGTIAVRGAGTRAATPGEELFFTLLFVLLVILGGEAVRVWVARAFAPDESLVSSSAVTSWGPVARGRLIYGLIGASVFNLLVFGLDVVLLLFLIGTSAARRGALPWTFWLVVFVYAGYLLVRRSLLPAAKAATKPGSPGARVFGAALPSYHLSGDTIVLDLKRKREPPPGKRPFISLATEPCIVKIRFEELDEIRALTYVQAQAYVQNSLGPDLKIALESLAEWYRYINGEIDRPSVYGQWGSGGTVLMLRGPNLFYLVSVSNTDVNDLVADFDAYRASGSS